MRNSFIVPTPSLREQWGGDKEIRTVTAETVNQPGIKELLAKAHAGIYSQVFPVEKGGMPLEGWLSRLEDTHSNISYHIAIAGSGLHENDRKEPEINGVCVGVYFKDSNVATLAYIVVDRESRKYGLGCQLRKVIEREFADASRKNGCEPQGWFLDCENPREVKGNGKHGYSPAKRLEKYFSWGGRVVNCDFVLPSKYQESRDRDSLLLIFPSPETGKYPDNRQILTYIREQYISEGIMEPEKDKDFMRIVEQLSRKSPSSSCLKATCRNGGLLDKFVPAEWAMA